MAFSIRFTSGGSCSARCSRHLIDRCDLPALLGAITAPALPVVFGCSRFRQSFHHLWTGAVMAALTSMDYFCIRVFRIKCICHAIFSFQPTRKSEKTLPSVYRSGGAASISNCRSLVPARRFFKINSMNACRPSVCRQTRLQRKFPFLLFCHSTILSLAQSAFTAFLWGNRTLHRFGDFYRAHGHVRHSDKSRTKKRVFTLAEARKTRLNGHFIVQFDGVFLPCSLLDILKQICVVILPSGSSIRVL